MAEHDELIRSNSVALSEIVRQRELGWPDFHPEHYCHNCGQPNACWFTPSEFWNRAETDLGGILCPVCFMRDYEEHTGKRVVWRIEPDLENDHAYIKSRNPQAPADGRYFRRRRETMTDG